MPEPTTRVTAPEPKMWGLRRTPELDRLIDIVHHALFAEDGNEGPVFRWTDQDAPMLLDDDQLLGCAADQVAFALLDRRAEVLALIATIAGSEFAA